MNERRQESTLLGLTRLFLDICAALFVVGWDAVQQLFRRSFGALKRAVRTRLHIPD
jgi:hypothetical protein